MRAAVTGATGFVGPHLCDHLRAAGDEVVELGDEHGACDITDRASIEQLLRTRAPEVVYHLAAFSNVAASWREPTACLRVNVEGTQNVLDAARAAGVRRVLVVGSAEEYGIVDPSDIPLLEYAPIRPVSPYGASKVAASFLALQAWLGAGLETIRVRPFNHTGPGQTTAFFVPGFAARIVAAERAHTGTVTAGSLDAVRDLTDVRDIVRAYRMLMCDGTPGEVYNVSRGEGVRISEVADKLLARAERPLHIEFDPKLMRPADIPVLIGDSGRLRAATGWTPEIALDDTLDAVLADVRARVAQGS
jgi:GDP-4-dehydro-6-deoxy-D-mannose reductase